MLNLGQIFMNTIVIKLGGSVFSTKDKPMDFNYLQKFKEVLKPYIDNQIHFGIVAGGGYTMRMYRDLAKSEGGIQKDEDLHWIGTTTNVLHAEIIRTVFGDLAEPRPIMYDEYYDNSPLNLTRSVVVGGGGRPGHSGDVDSVLLAIRLGATRVISLKNIERVYSADPNSDPLARPLDRLSWTEYLDIIGNVTEHKPGGNFPIDPVASRISMENKIEFVVMGGFDLKNFEKYLRGEDFVGTIIL